MLNLYFNIKVLQIIEKINKLLSAAHESIQLFQTCIIFRYTEFKKEKLKAKKE